MQIEHIVRSNILPIQMKTTASSACTTPLPTNLCRSGLLLRSVEAKIEAVGSRWMWSSSQEGGIFVVIKGRNRTRAVIRVKNILSDRLGSTFRYTGVVWVELSI